MRYFISDNHFEHSNIIKYCGRPFTNTFEMNKTMIENWNETVTMEDTVIFLGDFALGKREDFLTLLNYKEMIFILGNHDNHKRLNYVIEENNLPVTIFNKRYTANIEGNNYECVHKPKHAINDTEFVLHGHVHQLYKHKIENGKIYLNCSVEVQDYRPISELEIHEIFTNLAQVEVE